jgi:hypothetical protein
LYLYISYCNIGQYESTNVTYTINPRKLQQMESLNNAENDKLILVFGFIKLVHGQK